MNVGGHQNVSVAAIAKKLGLKNIGAAGTFVSHGKLSAAALKKAIAAELGFTTEIIVVPGAKVQALVAKAPLARVEGRPFVAVLAKLPSKVPKLPVEDGKGSRLVATAAKRGADAPAGASSVDGPFALAVVLPDAKPGTTVTGLAEKALGVPATVRGWPTIERVAKALEDAK